jgi:hypothetical protein
MPGLKIFHGFAGFELGSVHGSVDDFASGIAPCEEGARRVFSLESADSAILVYHGSPPRHHEAPAGHCLNLITRALVNGEVRA